MQMQNYRTVLKPIETETVIKKSRFIAQVHPVRDEAEVGEILTAVKKEHYKATHVCSAYILNTVPEKKKASDDGEPSGTAGRPILDVIERKNLKNVLVLVIRYFGGIKLGASGLVRAYAGAAAEVLSAATLIDKTLCDTPKIVIDYPQYGALANKLTEWGTPPVGEIFEDKVTLSFEIPTSETEAFHQKLIDTLSGRLDWSLGEQIVVDKPAHDLPTE